MSRPRAEVKKIEVWSHERAWAVRAALPDRFKIAVPVGAGLGLRQGEVFGLSPDDLDREAEVVHVVRQIRLAENKPVFAPPKRGMTLSVACAASRPGLSLGDIVTGHWLGPLSVRRIHLHLIRELAQHCGPGRGRAELSVGCAKLVP